GWAPLPPRAEFDAQRGWRFNGVTVGLNFDFGLRPDHFTFIALRDFGDRDYGRRRLPRTEVTRIYNQTTVINNYTVNNNTIINKGIQPDHVAAATHSEIRKVPIRDVPLGAGGALRSSGADRSNLVVYRQRPRPASPQPRMTAPTIDARQTVVPH